MAYNRNFFNPDALPAHAQPEEAAQALAGLQANSKPLPPRPSSQSPHNAAVHRRNSPTNQRPPPSSLAAQHSYRPQPSQQYQHQSPYQQPNLYQHNPNASNNPPASMSSRIHSPPPVDYGYGPRPSPPAQPRPSEGRASHSSSSYPSRTPRPPSPDSSDLFSLFRAANASNTGSLTSAELGSALVNADYSAFDPLTIRTMMRLFSSDPQQATVTYPEFQNLWRFLAAWRELFERFDEDSSGRVSLGEFSKALVAFGYRLSQPFVGVLYNAFNDKGIREAERRGSGGMIAQGMSFDLFVQACISLKRMTDVFKGYDEDRDGYVTLSFEEFLTEILRLRE